MIQELRLGHYAAIISDDTQLIIRANADKTCKLHILDDHLDAIDIAFAFRKDFFDRRFEAAVSKTLLTMQEMGELEVQASPSLQYR